MAKPKKPTTPAVNTTTIAPTTIEGAVSSVILTLIALFKGEVFSPTTKVGDKEYLSGGALFGKMGVVKPSDKLGLRPIIDGIWGGNPPAGVDAGKVARLVAGIKKRFPDCIGVCYRPNFQWSAPQKGEKKMTFGLGRDWPLFQSRWESSYDITGTPHPEVVAPLYGVDEYGPLMTADYALHIAKEAKKHGMAITLPPKKGRGRHRDVSSAAETELQVDSVLAEFGL